MLPGRPGGVLGALATIVAGVVALLLGVFFFAVFLALILVAAAVIGVRVWWLRRKLARHVAEEGGTGKRRAPTPPGRGTILEGDYHRVDQPADKTTDKEQ